VTAQTQPNCSFTHQKGRVLLLQTWPVGRSIGQLTHRLAHQSHLSARLVKREKKKKCHRFSPQTHPTALFPVLKKKKKKTRAESAPHRPPNLSSTLSSHTIVITTTRGTQGHGKVQTFFFREICSLLWCTTFKRCCFAVSLCRLSCVGAVWLHYTALHYRSVYVVPTDRRLYPLVAVQPDHGHVSAVRFRVPRSCASAFPPKGGPSPAIFRENSWKKEAWGG
jgi:hypothetical protein